MTITTDIRLKLAKAMKPCPKCQPLLELTLADYRERYGPEWQVDGDVECDNCVDGEIPLLPWMQESCRVYVGTQTASHPHDHEICQGRGWIPHDPPLEEILVKLTELGFAPALVYDDNGHWAVSMQGVSPAKEKPEAMTVLLQDVDWCNTPKEAFYRALAKMLGVLGQTKPVMG